MTEFCPSSRGRVKRVPNGRSGYILCCAERRRPHGADWASGDWLPALKRQAIQISPFQGELRIVVKTITARRSAEIRPLDLPPPPLRHRRVGIGGGAGLGVDDRQARAPFQVADQGRAELAGGLG